eukprot:SAG22_NODE_635_length_8370_cov_33.081127_9_plen_74_part_00
MQSGAAEESGEFDARKFAENLQLEEWLNLNQAGAAAAAGGGGAGGGGGGKGSCVSAKLKASPLARLQFPDPAW